MTVQPQKRKSPFFFFSFCCSNELAPRDMAEPAGDGIGEGAGRNLFGLDDGAAAGEGAGAGASLI
jgi:hypothetical protein